MHKKWLSGVISYIIAAIEYDNVLTAIWLSSEMITHLQECIM